jgi:hypothetical protein
MKKASFHSKAHFGYHPQKVKQYADVLEGKAASVERRLQEQSEKQIAEQEELLRRIADVKRELDEIEHMETNLKQWIQRN